MTQTELFPSAATGIDEKHNVENITEAMNKDARCIVYLHI
jgi:hypothetical protein